MRIIKLLNIVALPLVLTLVACSPSNPLIGKWKPGPISGMPINGTMEFKSDSIEEVRDGVSTEYKTDYTIEKGRVGVSISIPDKNVTSKATAWYKIIDPDTIELNTAGVDMLFHRIKN